MLYYAIVLFICVSSIYYFFSGLWLVLETTLWEEKRRGKDLEYKQTQREWGVRGNDRRSQTVATPDGNSFCSLQTEVGTV